MREEAPGMESNRVECTPITHKLFASKFAFQLSTEDGELNSTNPGDGISSTFK